MKPCYAPLALAVSACAVFAGIALVAVTAPLLSLLERWLAGREKRAACLAGRCGGSGCWCGGSD